MIVASGVRAQGSVDTQRKVFHNQESTIAIELTSNGYGFDYRYGKRKDGFKKRLYEFSFNEVRHPKEIRYATRSKKYVFGKLNTFYTLSAGYGIQDELFSKLDKGGVAIRLTYTAGVVAGILKPYYYLRDSTSEKGDYVVTEQFKTSAHTDYLGHAPFFVGIEETRVVPGLYGNIGASFEFGEEVRKIRALECGVETMIFAREIPQMASDDNSFFFFSLYVRLRIGRIIGKY